MDFRKLIKFGSNSHVISLPRTWLSKNNLEKGAVVYFHENGNNELILTPAEAKTKREDKEIVIDAHGKNIETFRRELVSAYMNGYNIIKIVDKDLKNRAIEIRNELQNLMALEVMEQTQTSIITRDLLKLDDVDLSVLIRRMDILTRTMILDLKPAIKDGTAQFANLRYRDQDVNRVFYVVKRLASMGVADSNFAAQIKTTPADLFKTWTVALSIEAIADEVKRIAELLEEIKISDPIRDFLFRLFSELEDGYLCVMKAYHTKDPNLALSYSDKRNELFRRCAELFVKVNRQSETNLRVFAIAERFNNMIDLINKIARSVYD